MQGSDSVSMISELERERRRSRMLLAAALAALVVLLAAVIPSPYSVERPGPVVDTLGKITIEDEQHSVVSIKDEKTYPTEGKLNLLTVSIMGTPDQPASWLSLLPALFDPSQRIAPRSEFFPEGMTTDDRDTQNTVLMDASQLQSAAAAFRELGKDVGVELTVADVTEGGPSDGALETGDRVISVNGVESADFRALRESIVASGSGVPLALGIVRDGAELTVEITPTEGEQGEGPVIGATIAMAYELPAEVDISLSKIGGPSAGMTFALAVVDKLTPGSMLNGLTVSGTGTMNDAGQVGPIGGLTQKMWAASRVDTDLFLMPIGNCIDVPDRVPDGLVVAPVATLDEAISAIETVAAGGTAPGLERCATAG